MKKFIFLASVMLSIAGCTTSPKSFIKNAYTLDDTDICQNYKKDFVKLSQKYKNDELSPLLEDYLNKLRYQFARRDLSESKCSRLIAENNRKILIGIAAVAATAATVNAIDNGSGGGYSGYAWDQFYNSNYTLTWRCRNKSNGQFVPNQYCSSQYKVDSTWPAK